LPFVRKDEVRKLAAVLAGLVVLQKLAGDVWVWMPKKLHSLNGGHAHHDARRDWEAPFGVPSSPILGWLSMEGILVCEREAIFTREFPGIRLGHLFCSFGIKRGDDGVSEDRLRDLGRE
jgi:hypothetical protein